MKRWLCTLSTKVKATLMVATLLAAQVVGATAPFVSKAYAAPPSNPAANLDQCRNGTLAAPAQCIDSGGSVGWVNGNAGASDSHWREGDSLAYRMLFSGLATTGSHTVTIQWDTTKGGKHALDYLTTYNRTETTADPCSGVAGCSSPTTFPIPTDPNVTAAGPLHPQIAGDFTLYNGTITAVSSYTVSGTYASDSSTSITLTFSAATATPVLAWGGHIASQIDWGFGNSASAISGSPYHMRLLDLDGSGGNQDRSLSAAAVFPTPTITTQASASTINLGQSVTDLATLVGPSQSSPTVTGTVAFFVCGPAATNPDCSTGGTAVGSAVTLSGGQATSAAFTPTATGSYCFRAEYAPAADAPYSPQNHTNLDTECFTVTQAPSTITIIKDAQPNSSQDFAFTTTGTGLSNFSLDDDSDPTLSNTQTFTGLMPGTYTVTEQAVAGWDFSSLNCGAATNVAIDGTTVTITITGGQSVTCTYVNQQRGRIIVNKVTNPANDLTGFPITATSSTGGNITGGGSATVYTNAPVTYDVSQGTYAVSETVPAGWTQTDNTCSNLVISASTPLVNGVPTLTCTITNTKLAKLTIVKDAVPNDAQDFAFTTTGTGLSNFSLDDDSDPTLSNTQTFTGLMPGTYGVSETSLPGWMLTGLTCDTNNFVIAGAMVSVTLAAGQETTCTYTNTKLGSISGTKYEANANGTTVKTLSGWVICLDANNNGVCDPSESTQPTGADGSFSFTGLLPGTYSLLENLLSGWTQIFHPSSVNLTAGQASTGNNFGNFQNGSISGYKWNDQNGDGVKQEVEPTLSNWTIKLYQGETVKATTTTDADGNYSFGNLAPGTYDVCEVQQTGWTQTYPAGNACHDVIVALSGHDYANMNFGNRAHGTITVIKNVDDGFGHVTLDATGWTWNYDGLYTSASNVTASSANQVVVPAGDYAITENQQTDYHFTSLVCNNRTQDGSTGHVTVSANSNIVCTYTNARDTGTVTVTKYLDPETDNGVFNLQVDGATRATNVSNGEGTGDVKVLTGTHSVSELAGTDTNLSDYDSSYACYNGETLVVSGDATVSDSFSVGSNQTLDCYFTNTRHAQLTVVKKAFPANSAQSFNFTLTKVTPIVDEEVQTETNDQSVLNMLGTTTLVKNFQLDDNTDPTLPNSDTTALSAGVYEVSEDSTSGWNLVGMDCGDVVTVKTATSIRFELQPGQQLTCTFTNQKHVVPQVLGAATTELTNTGLPIIAYIMASLTIMGVALFTSRRQTNS